MSNDTTEAKRRTITLTDRAPVRILETDWPVIAHGSYAWHDNQHRSQANRTKDINIRVRQHDDGRAIVYGVYDYSTSWQGASGLEVKAGVMCAFGADLAGAVREVGEQLIGRLTEHGSEDVAHVHDAVAECIGDLPAVDL